MESGRWQVESRFILEPWLLGFGPWEPALSVAEVLGVSSSSFFIRCVRLEEESARFCFGFEVVEIFAFGKGTNHIAHRAPEERRANNGEFAEIGMTKELSGL